MPRYAVCHGILVPLLSALYKSPYCEINVAHHCNLSCRGCSHLSPVWPKEFLHPAQLKSDLAKLAKVYRAERIRLLGGEPLLHPELVELIRVVRGSGVSRRIAVATNGVLLPRQPEKFWEEIDEVDVTLYPGKQLSVRELWKCRRLARRFEVKLRLSLAGNFRESYSETGTSDKALVRRIYDTCLIAHQWNCHNVENGYFFKCPQALLLPRALAGKLSSRTADGLALSDEPEFGKSLRDYLESHEPLESCRHCLGSVGKRFSHEQVPRGEFRTSQKGPTEELLDEARLASLEENFSGADDTHLPLGNAFQFLRFLPRLLARA